MRVLLDSHTVVWAVDNPALLGPNATPVLQDAATELLISAATVWELSIKSGLGKLSLSKPFRDWMAKAVHDLGATILPFTIEHADAQTRLGNIHRDPFDRLLAAQALTEKIAVVSNDPIFERYGAERIW